jgi:prevent-host-death family protein
LFPVLSAGRSTGLKRPKLGLYYGRFLRIVKSLPTQRAGFAMMLSECVKPISYVKTHASEVIRQVNRDGKPLFVTLNGEAKVVIEDIREYEKLQETLSLLKLLALGRREVENGDVRPASEAFANIDTRISAAKASKE